MNIDQIVECFDIDPEMKHELSERCHKVVKEWNAHLSNRRIVGLAENTSSELAPSAIAEISGDLDELGNEVRLIGEFMTMTVGDMYQEKPSGQEVIKNLYEISHLMLRGEDPLLFWSASAVLGAYVTNTGAQEVSRFLKRIVEKDLTHRIPELAYSLLDREVKESLDIQYGTKEKSDVTSAVKEAICATACVSPNLEFSRAVSNMFIANFEDESALKSMVQHIKNEIQY